MTPESIAFISAAVAAVLSLVAFDLLAMRFGADSRERRLDDRWQ